MIPEIYPKATMAEYLAVKAFSGGLAQTLLNKSALHAWTDSPWNPARERDDSDAADIGTFAHACLLEGGTDALVICPFDDWRKNDAKAMREQARSMEKLPILQHKVPEVEAMVKAAKEYVASSEIAGVFDTGSAEQTLVWYEAQESVTFPDLLVPSVKYTAYKEGTGVLCKARPDWLTADRKLCLSYKTTKGSAQPDAWIRTQLPGYDAGMVLYERGVRALCEVEAVRLVHLVQEQAAPYSCSLIALSPAWCDLAERKLDTALAIWKSCLQSGVFPAYPTRICYAEPKPWQLEQAEEQETEGTFADPSILWGKPE